MASKQPDQLKDRNDPGRFFGDGVTFKAKLIGILEVGEARGDRMCQEALMDLKIAIRAAGEHKQRITIHVTLDGLRLRDEKTGDCLYHHPVHKISFIAQDMTDSRAFGYIFGSPDSGHRFFGIKTDKTASQVVLAMRDLFQVVFELKKKEIELARQNIQTKAILAAHSNSSSHPLQTDTGIGGSSSAPGTSIPLKSVKNEDSTYGNQPSKLTLFTETSLMGAGSSSSGTASGTGAGASGAGGGGASNSGDLVDLEQELSSIQRGISQMERITPNDCPSSTRQFDSDDPFGDSFANTFQPYNILPPPPETVKSRHSKPLKPPLERATSDSSPPLLPPPGTSPKKMNSNRVTASPVVMHQQRPQQQQQSPKCDSPHSWSNNNINNNNNNNNLLDEDCNRSSHHQMDLDEKPPPRPQRFDDAAMLDEPLNSSSQESSTTAVEVTKKYLNAFTDLDPLGTGKSKPYVDKKYFFQDLKNPPKKVLKDLSSSDVSFSAQFPIDGQLLDDDAIMPDAGDPFPGSTAEDDDPFRKVSESPEDPFEVGFPEHEHQTVAEMETVSELLNTTTTKEPPSDKRTQREVHYSGTPLKVNLPPEPGWTAKERLNRTQSSDQPAAPSTVRNRPAAVLKQNTMGSGGIASIGGSSSKKMTMKPNLFGQKFPRRDSNMRRLQESDSLSENDTPEPPPRPDIGSTFVESPPPPLPPKKQFSDVVVRPSAASLVGSSTSTSTSRYASSSTAAKELPSNRNDYTSNKSKVNSFAGDAPPLPLPMRKIGRSDPSKMLPKAGGQDEDDDYLTPCPQPKDMPIVLLPPPQTGTTKRSGRKPPAPNAGQGGNDLRRDSQATELSVSNAETTITDITLSQLLTLSMDELAHKLNVPVQKLSTMTIIELTKYLSEFINRSSSNNNNHNSTKRSITPTRAAHTTRATPEPTRIEQQQQQNMFRVSFDEQANEGGGATFVAVFDDNFGEETHHDDHHHHQQPFVANFDHMDMQPEEVVGAASQTQSNVDKYAAFREIMDTEGPSSMDSRAVNREDGGVGGDGDGEADSATLDCNDIDLPRISPLAMIDDGLRPGAPFSPPSSTSTFDATMPTLTKIDTKITEAIANAKDRYAALRDIILVEDLFERSKTPPSQFSSLSHSHAEPPESVVFDEDDEFGGPVPNAEEYLGREEPETPKTVEGMRQSPEITVESATEEESRETAVNVVREPSKEKSFTPTFRDDIEIDELMNLAVSNLSLNNMASLSPRPAIMAADIQQKNASTSPILRTQSGTPSMPEPPQKIKVCDTSTSPIPIQQKVVVPLSPIPGGLIIDRSSNQLQVTGHNDGDSVKASSSLSDLVCASPSDLGDQGPKSDANGSWAVFEQDEEGTATVQKGEKVRSPRISSNNMESPCSSDGKDELKLMDRKWPGKGHTSSSSRDVSPWDDEYGVSGGGGGGRDGVVVGDGRHSRPSPGIATDRQGHYMRHGRRMDSCDEDYEYEADYKARRRQQQQQQQPAAAWYHSDHPGNWSPPDFDDDHHGRRDRSFDRNSYERSTFGPPFPDSSGSTTSKQREQNAAMKSYRNYEKRKFYSNYGRKNYDYDYAERTGGGGDGDATFDTSPSSFHRSSSRERMKREYYMSRDRQSFDRESNESYESGSGGGGGGVSRKSKRDYREGFGSMDLMRDDYGLDVNRNRYLSTEKVSRGSRKGLCTSSISSGRRSNLENYDDDDGYEHEDSDPDQSSRHYHSSKHSRSTGAYLGEGSRSLQRPCYGSSSSKTAAAAATAPRKRGTVASSGLSPWSSSGGDPQSEGSPVVAVGHKQWASAMRPSSASEPMDRRKFFAASQATIASADNEKERRLRLKSRGSSASSTTPRSAGHRRHEQEFYFDDDEAMTAANVDPISDGNDRIGSTSDAFYSPTAIGPPAPVTALRSPRGCDGLSGKGKPGSRKGQQPPGYYGPPPDMMLEDGLRRSSSSASRGGGAGEQQQQQMFRKSNLRGSSAKSSMKVQTSSGGQYSGGADVDLDDENYGRSRFDEYADHETDFRSSSSINNNKLMDVNRFHYQAATTAEQQHQGFESDFILNSPKQKTTATQQLKGRTAAFRFSNDFSGCPHFDASAAADFEKNVPQKLRFNDKIKVSQFQTNFGDDEEDDDEDDRGRDESQEDTGRRQHVDMFEDDFSDSQPVVVAQDVRTTTTTTTMMNEDDEEEVVDEDGDEALDQWTEELPKSGGVKKRGGTPLLVDGGKGPEHIRKSESVNIFAKKYEDPFEDDDFFKAGDQADDPTNGQRKQMDSWNTNFAKFD